MRADAGGRGEASGAGLERTYGARAELGLAPRGALAVTLRAGAPAQKTSENRAIRGGHRNNPEHNLRASNHHHNPLSFFATNGLCVLCASALKNSSPTGNEPVASLFAIS